MSPPPCSGIRISREHGNYSCSPRARPALDKVRPLLERLGRRLFVIGEHATLANLVKLTANASRSGFSRSRGTLRGPRIDAPRSPRIGRGSPLLLFCAIFAMIVCPFLRIFSSIGVY